LCALLCYLILAQQIAYAVTESNAPNTSHNSSDSSNLQAAEILQIRPEVDRLLILEKQADSNGTPNEELLALRALVVRKVFLGFLDVRRACNKIDIELDYTYGVMGREQAKRDTVNRWLNTANFAQFAVLYTMQPYARINKNFKESAILTLAGSGIGLILPISGLIYNKYSKAHNTQPPAFMKNILDGGPVDGNGMPPLVERFLNSNSPGEQISRKEAIYALWKKRYGVDASKQESLCSLRGEGGKSLGLLNTRIILLWSLSTRIADLDRDLLALLKVVRSGSHKSNAGEENVSALGLSPGALEAAQLLKIEPTVVEAIRLKNQNNVSDRKTELDIEIMESVLIGMLGMRVATDKIDGEINYQYDVVLSELLRRRAHNLQLNYDVNFMQVGIFGSIAGLLYLKNYGKAGNLMFVIEKSFATILSSLGLWQLRGGTRKVDTPPNTLAQWFNPDGSNQYQFDPMIAKFLDNPYPEWSNGKSRREFLLTRWKIERVATINLDSKANQKRLAELSPEIRDTITIVRNRIDLMTSLKALLEEFDGELYSLLEATEPTSKYDAQTDTLAASQLNPAASGAAKLLQIQPTVERLAVNSNGGAVQLANIETTKQQVFITSRILLAALDARKAVDKLDLQIAIETAARDRLVRQRDLAVNITNNLNFFQIGILGLISAGPLGLSGEATERLYGDRLNIISGYMVAGLAAAALVEHHGGIRLTKAQPNTLGAAFNIQTAPAYQLSQTLTNFFNSVPPDSIDGLTRKDELNKYWMQTKVISINVEKRSNQEKLAAEGPAHHFWSETIKLISNRIRMLYDMRAIIDQIDVGLSDLLRSVG
jgi:hypothetical protein